MDSKDMRSLVIYGGQDFQAIEELNKLENWNLHKNGQEGHPYFLQKGEIKIYIRLIAENVVHTSNILPQDLKNSSIELADDALLSLTSDLEKAEIEHTIDMSENDKNRLLSTGAKKV